MARPRQYDETGKVCKGCGEKKPLDAFYSYPRKVGTGVNVLPRCKPCHVAQTDGWRLAKHGGRRQARLHETWRMSESDYQILLDRQSGVCAVCQRPPLEGKYLDVDHDHACCPSNRSCGRCVRGLLCRSCNSGLHMVERPERMARALAYLGRAG